MSRHNADSARLANQSMVDTAEVVNAAKGSMDHLMESMQEIAGASREMQSIIKSIDEIAFQTNLLALNAAVEAARAGEAGAGFAVVADEVRSLALRAADAVKHTSDLIEETVRKIRSGADLAATAHNAFAKVSEGSARVACFIDGITVASGEQAQGVEQISEAVTEMDQVTQQNAANAEESAAAAEEMNTQAVSMNSYVAQLTSLVNGHMRGVNGRSAPTHAMTVTQAESREYGNGSPQAYQARIINVRTPERRALTNGNGNANSQKLDNGGRDFGAEPVPAAVSGTLPQLQLLNPDESGDF